MIIRLIGATVASGTVSVIIAGLAYSLGCEANTCNGVAYFVSSVVWLSIVRSK
jgi:mannose/fructose/N-acetylgalactosamine-specific phosphotransferase system component IID